MNAKTQSRAVRPLNLFLGLAAVVVILAGMKAASLIVVPFLLALFITIILAPFFFWLQGRGIPGALAFALICVLLLGAGFLGVGLMNQSIRQLNSKIPEYQTKASIYVEDFDKWLNSMGVETPDDRMDQILNSGALFQYTGRVLGAASGILGQTFIIFLVAAFMLFEAAILPSKIRSLPNVSPDTYARLERSILDVRRYLAIKTIMSLLTGFLVFVLLLVLDIDFPILLGVTAFLLNFVPNVGSIIAAVPGVAMGLFDHGVSTGVMCMIGYVCINVGISNFIEPRYMGKGLGLSTLIVIISLIFWGWLLGPIGMLLSIPLTMALKIGLESSPDTHWIGILMGGAPGKAELEQAEERLHAQEEERDASPESRKDDSEAEETIDSSEKRPKAAKKAS